MHRYNQYLLCILLHQNMMASLDTIQDLPGFLEYADYLSARPSRKFIHDIRSPPLLGPELYPGF